MELTIAEQLLYSTVKISSSKNGTPLSMGTGFFVNFPVGDDENVIVIVTNKHVIEGSTEVTVVIHLAFDGSPSGKFKPYVISTDHEYVIRHPDEDIDLCGVVFGPCIHHAESVGETLFHRNLTLPLVPTEEEWNHFDAIEDVTMVGCPRGINDEANNLPIVRRGITATPLSKKYNAKNEFMVDMACFPGSSGSPIFLYDRNGYFDRKENTYRLGASRLKLVGVLYSGPLVTNSGQIVFSQVPSVTVNSMMHLGYALRATELHKLHSEILRRLAVS